MSVQKEKKLKKLKKQRTWPYVFGIVMVILIFAALAVTVLCLRFIGLVYDKVQLGYDNSRTIAQTIDMEQTESLKDMQEICISAFRLMPYVSDIGISDSNQKMLYQFGKGKLDWSNSLDELSSSRATLILDNDASSIIYANGNMIQIDVGKVMDIISGRLRKQNRDVTAENMMDSDVFTTLKFWYVIPFDGGEYNICVRNDIPIKTAEIMFMAAVVDVIIVLAGILLIYYLFSVLGLFRDRRNMIRIIGTDPATGGNNMEYFRRFGSWQLKKNRRNKNNYAVAVLRMEKYANFCTCYGITEGEELVEAFYHLLDKLCGKREILAHCGNAEFAMLLLYQNEEELTKRLNDILSGLNGVKKEQKKYFTVGISRVQGSCKNVNIEELYNCAGVARDKIAEDSDRRIEWFSDQMKQDQLWNRTVENDMERALINKEFQVYLQPKYSTKEEILSGAEALVRWIHPTEGFVPPFKFIPIFESNGFVVQLDDYMITEVARQQAKWIEEGKNAVPISVNVSRVHFVQEDLAENICRMVDQFKVPHHLIELELTESAFFDDKNVLLNTISKLKSYGFPISMDDFGSGYSSLNSLKELPLDIVKLDAGFFREEDKSGRGRLIVGDTISLAKKLDMKIVAEGIETREQVDFLADLDCDLIQGYYFAKPMPISEFEEKAFGGE